MQPDGGSIDEPKSIRNYRFSNNILSPFGCLWGRRFFTLGLDF